MKYEFKGTKGVWHAVEYAGFVRVQTSPYYGDGVDVLQCEQQRGDDINIEEMKANGALCAGAKELLIAAIKVVESNNPLQFHEHVQLLEEAILTALNTDAI